MIGWLLKKIHGVFAPNQFDISIWIISSLLLFIAILALIPIMRAFVGLGLILASKVFHTRQVPLYRLGVKLLPAFFRAALGVGLALSFSQPAHASNQTIVIDRVVDVEATTAPQSNSTYIVKSGDSLWKIAENHMTKNDPSVSEIDTAWRELWQRNRDVIGDNPSLIYVGQELVLP